MHNCSMAPVLWAGSYEDLADQLTVKNLRRSSIFCLTNDADFVEHTTNVTLPIIRSVAPTCSSNSPRLVLIDRKLSHLLDALRSHAPVQIRSTTKKCGTNMLTSCLRKWITRTDDYLKLLLMSDELGSASHRQLLTTHMRYLQQLLDCFSAGSLDNVEKCRQNVNLFISDILSSP